jgi:hypothetical protein
MLIIMLNSIDTLIDENIFATKRKTLHLQLQFKFVFNYNLQLEMTKPIKKCFL